MRAEKDRMFQELESEAVKQGWGVERTARNHFRFRPKDKTKPLVIFAGSPSDIRAMRNFVAMLKRSGLICPGQFGAKKETG